MLRSCFTRGGGGEGSLPGARLSQDLEPGAGDVLGCLAGIVRSAAGDWEFTSGCLKMADWGFRSLMFLVAEPCSFEGDPGLRPGMWSSFPRGCPAPRPKEGDPPHPQALSLHCCLHPTWSISIHALIHRSIHAFTHRPIHAFIHSSSYAFVYRSIDVFIHSSIHTFLQPPTPPLLSAQVGQTPAKPGGGCERAVTW